MALAQAGLLASVLSLPAAAAVPRAPAPAAGVPAFEPMLYIAQANSGYGSLQGGASKGAASTPSGTKGGTAASPSGSKGGAAAPPPPRPQGGAGGSPAPEPDSRNSSR